MGDRIERDPKPLGDLMKMLVDRRGWDRKMSLGTLREAWAEVVGENVARRSEPLKVDDGVLVVRAESSAWASELTMLGSSLAAKADRFLGSKGYITAVRVVAGTGRGSDRRTGSTGGS